MDDEATKEDNQPSTSKKDISQRTTSGNDLYDGRGHDEGASNSETSVSATYSARSRVDMADARPEPPKPALGKREGKAPERKKRGRRNGRIEKRRRSYTRRQFRRAPMRRKQAIRHVRADDRRIREHSVSTIFTRLSSRSGSRSPGCVHCGHRCCRRRAKRFVVRYEYERRRYYACRRYRMRRMPKKKIVGARKLKKKPGIKLFTGQFTASLAKQNQTGSRSQMLSPLFITTNSSPEEVVLSTQRYCGVSPEMIFESLCVLTQWKQGVQTTAILEYLKRKYPVNRVETELLKELREKLRVATIAGIVEQLCEDFWTLSGELEQRKLSANHVTLFWDAYADTLKPVPMKEAKPQLADSFNDNTEARRDFCAKDDLV